MLILFTSSYTNALTHKYIYIYIYIYNEFSQVCIQAAHEPEIRQVEFI